jgi:hypothetical protein
MEPNEMGSTTATLHDFVKTIKHLLKKENNNNNNNSKTTACLQHKISETKNLQSR